MQRNKSNKTISYFHSERFKPSKLSKYFWMLSGTLFLIGFIMLFTVGFNLGLDFTGGNVMNIQTGSQIDTKKVEVESKIKEVLNAEGATVGRYQIVNEGTADAYIALQYQNIAGLDSEEMETRNEQIKQRMQLELAGVLDEPFTVGAAETKSATASTDLLINSLLALIIAVIAMLIYIAIRFELISGLTAILTLLHDVIFMCAMVVIFGIEINSAFIAAIITVLAYSVNNTIIIFDRIRENLRKETLMGKSNKEIADISVRQTLTRTFNTSITTIVVVALLAIIGVPAIRDFIVPILLGLIAGTYAAIFISAPLWAKITTNSRFDKRTKERVIAKVGNDKIIETTAEPLVE